MATKLNDGDQNSGSSCSAFGSSIDGNTFVTTTEEEEEEEEEEEAPSEQPNETSTSSAPNKSGITAGIVSSGTEVQNTSLARARTQSPNALQKTRTRTCRVRSPRRSRGKMRKKQRLLDLSTKITALTTEKQALAQTNEEMRSRVHALNACLALVRAQLVHHVSQEGRAPRDGHVHQEERRLVASTASSPPACEHNAPLLGHAIDGDDLRAHDPCESEAQPEEPKEVD